MARTVVRLEKPETKDIQDEIARLGDLNIKDLQARWRTALRRPPPAHLSRQLLFRMLAYRVQADRFGDLDAECRRILDRLDSKAVVGKERLTTDLKRSARTLQPGTVLTREWNGKLHQVVVQTAGFIWDGKTYKSLSKIASEIAGSRWNGPRFFGLRDNNSAKARA